jgi:hypothetical protein
MMSATGFPSFFAGVGRFATARRVPGPARTPAKENLNMENRELRTVPFHGDEIVTFEAEGVRYVAMRRIVENMGLSWGSQHDKLMDQKTKFSCTDIATTGADGKIYEMLAMPVEKLPLWLASINPNKIKSEPTRAKVERYQAESAIALHDYWTKGVAVRGDMDGVVTDIGAEVRRAIGGIVKGIVHKELVSVLPQMVESAIVADSRRAALNVVSVRQLTADAIEKGRNSVNRKIGYGLRNRAAADPDGGKAFRCPHTGVWLFDRAFAERFMREAGDTMVRAHNDRIRGQGVLKLVPPKPEKDESDLPGRPA